MRIDNALPAVDFLYWVSDQARYDVGDARPLAPNPKLIDILEHL